MTVRIGVVGAGSVMQQVHLPSLRQLSGIAVVALVELNLELGRRVAAAFGAIAFDKDRCTVRNGEAKGLACLVALGKSAILCGILSGN